MRKIFTFLSILFVGGLAAQSLELVSQDNKVYYDAYTAGTDVDAGVKVKNNSATAKTFKVRVNPTTGALCSVHYFCWDLCYTPGVLVSTGSLVIQPGQTNDLFKGYIVSSGNGTLGTCSLTYTFFNVDDANDTLQVTIDWESVDNISVGENEPTVAAVFPNPAKDFVKVRMNNVNEGQFQIVNVIGQTVKTADIYNATSELNIDVTDLESGVYFYSLIVQGQAVETKRLVISK
ncbi:MAG: T9SS type A sorting domain-containing protein [Schleiferiaceae bacterium]|jgi:hypothetical protein|nr:T9SS type A sorting domain-containing protein [Schleiferiaceae bacterium]